jgi:hypothetical protein
MKNCPKCGLLVVNPFFCPACGQALSGDQGIGEGAPVPAPATAPPVIDQSVRSVRSRISYPIVGATAAGLGALVLFVFVSSTRSSATASAGLPAQHGVQGTTGVSKPVGAAEVTAVPAMRSAAPRWIKSGPSRRAGTGVMFELGADEDVDVWRKRVRPVLTVRCTSQEAEAFVVTHSAASIEPTGQHTVQVGFDDVAPISEMWEHSVDHDALFAPNGKTIAHQIASARRMSFTFTPFNAPPTSVHFSVSGFDEQLKSAARTCGWKR